MQARTFSLMGIPVEYLNSAEVVERVLALIGTYRNEQRDVGATRNIPSNYIITMNVDFLANIHGWRWFGIRHAELLNILRKSTIVTADGMPIVWLSKWLGNSLKERVTGADLVPLLAEMLGEKKKSIFLLGGEEKNARLAAEHLKKVDPGLKIAGISCPTIYVEGERLIEAQQRDALLIEEINEASPDVLFVGLGHPKQEIWFERVRGELQVPVAIGIGGTLNFITGTIKRAPRWMQSMGFEWLYRLYQEPKRLIFRYLFDMFDFLYLSIPLVVVHRLNQFITKLFKGKNACSVQSSLLFLSQQKSIAVVRIPEILCSKNAQIVNQHIDEAFAQDLVVLDLRKTRHIDLEGLGLLVNTWRRAQRENQEVLGLGVRWNLRLLMRMHKVWDLLRVDICSSPLQPLSNQQSVLYEAITQRNDTLTLRFFGKIDGTQNFEAYFEKIVQMLHQKDCILDFTYCTFIDNAGFTLLLQLKEFVESNGKALKIRGLTRTVASQFKLARIYKSFTRI